MEKVKSQIQIDTTKIVKINLNNTSIEELWNHPYLNYKQSKAIVNYRLQHGDFQNIKDIQNIVLIDSQLFRKIAPYLKIHD